MLRSRWTEAWDSADAPPVLPMPLQRVATSEAQYRVNRAAQDTSSGAYELATYFVGQVVGRMNKKDRCSEIVMNMMIEYAQTCERMGLLVDEL
jgi:NAD(P)H-dependent flavin oxidoreductase YrpB (nitropropane dioxygenase family)